MALLNTWHHRKVADSSAKACWICSKPSTSVLITPDNKDFFYICTGHLTDRGFCSPDADEVAALKAKKQKEELDKEIAKVTAEYEERKKNREKKKAERKKKKDKDKDKKADKEEAKKEDEEEEKDDKEKEAKLEALQTEGGKAEDSPRIFSLHKSFYQKRVNQIRNNELAKRNRERIRNPATFPSVPTSNP